MMKIRVGCIRCEWYEKTNVQLAGNSGDFPLLQSMQLRDRERENSQYTQFDENNTLKKKVEK